MRRILLASLILAAAPLFAATEPNPSARQRELVEKFLTLTNISANMPSMLDAVYAQMEKQFLDSAAMKGNDPDDVAEAKEMFANFRKRATAINFDADFHEAFVRIYSRYFTEQELADLNAFYSTPVGRKTVEVMPRLMADGMQVGAEQLTPKIEKIMSEVMADAEKKRPWRSTMKDIRSIATAVEAYSIDHDDKYPAGDYASLREALVPTYIKELPEKDMWGHTYAYVVSDDRAHYRVISSGADSNFEWDSRRIVLPKEGVEPEVAYRDRLEDDLIYADGQFVQLPVQARPKKVTGNR